MGGVPHMIDTRVMELGERRRITVPLSKMKEVT